MVERLILKFCPSTSTKGKTGKLLYVADFAGEFLYLVALILARRFPHLTLNPQKHSKITPTSQSITQRHGRGKFLAQKNPAGAGWFGYWLLMILLPDFDIAPVAITALKTLAKDRGSPPTSTNDDHSLLRKVRCFTDDSNIDRDVETI